MPGRRGEKGRLNELQVGERVSWLDMPEREFDDGGQCTSIGPIVARPWKEYTAVTIAGHQCQSIQLSTDQPDDQLKDDESFSDASTCDWGGFVHVQAKSGRGSECLGGGRGGSAKKEGRLDEEREVDVSVLLSQNIRRELTESWDSQAEERQGEREREVWTSLVVHTINQQLPWSMTPA